MLFGMRKTIRLSQLNFVYRAKVKAVCEPFEECGGQRSMHIDSSFDIQIEGDNCTNAEFAKRFFAVHGEGHLESDGWLVLYSKSLEVCAGDKLEIPSDVAFNAIIDNMVKEAEEVLEQLYADAIENIEKEFGDDTEGT